MKTSEAAKGKWAIIFDYFGCPPITGKKHYSKPCPMCKEVNSLRIDNTRDQGNWICKCGSGTGWAILQAVTNKSYSELATEVDDLIGNVRSRDDLATGCAMQTKEEKVIAAFHKNWATLLAMPDTLGAKYLASRGLYNPPRNSVKWCPQTANPQHLRGYGAIWAVATDEAYNPVYLHRTFINKDGVKYSGKPEDGRLLNCLINPERAEYAKSVAIRLCSPAETLGIAEGIETAMSAQECYGVNTWATLNTAFMKKFIAPLGTKHLIIFADCDKSAAGHAAAFACAFKNLNHKNSTLQRVTVRWPENGDFNDHQVDPRRICEWVFNK